MKGEGTNQHTLYGNFKSKENGDVIELDVTSESVLRHEQPDGQFGEHQPLLIKKGKWVTGKQVEYNPFDQKISRIWD